VLAPSGIVTLCEVISCVGAARLLSVFSGKHSHLGLDHQVVKLHSLDKVGVPNVASVGYANLIDLLGNLM